MNLLFIGGGNMGGAIAFGAVASASDINVTVVDPNVERARSILPEHDRINIVGSLDYLGDQPVDITIIAVKPQLFTALSDQEVAAMARGCVVSIMGGITLDVLVRRLGTERVIRTMPNLPAVVGQSMTVGVSSPGASDEDRRIAARLFETVGRLNWLQDEDLIDAATAISGSGPGYIFAFAEAMTAAAVELGFESDVADILVRQTFLGTAKMLSTDARSAEDLKIAVTSPGGTTQAGLSILEGPQGLAFLSAAAAKAARKRARELFS